MDEKREEPAHDSDWRARRRHPRKLSEFFEELGDRGSDGNAKKADPREP